MNIYLRFCSSLEWNSQNTYGSEKLKMFSSRAVEKKDAHFMYKTALQ